MTPEGCPATAAAAKNAGRGMSIKPEARQKEYFYGIWPGNHNPNEYLRQTEKSMNEPGVGQGAEARTWN